jgi:predicted transcriptional regulator
MNEKILGMMYGYVEMNGINFERVLKSLCGNWMTANEWSKELGVAISPQRLASMYNSGLVERIKNPGYFGDNYFHYFPKVRPACLED